MKITVKGLSAVLMITVLLVAMLAGCTANAPVTTPTASGDQALQDPTSGGLLLLNVNAAIDILYDVEGFVMSIRGVDANGKELAEAQGDVLGKNISDVVKALTTAAIEGSYLVNDEKAIIVKQSLGSMLPGSSFLENILADIQSVNNAIPIVLVAEENLDASGYINLETAKTILAEALDLDDIEIEGKPEHQNDLYAFTFTIDDIPQYYTVHANTGTVMSADISVYDEDYVIGVDPEGAMYDPYDPDIETVETFPVQDEILEEETEDIIEETEELMVAPDGAEDAAEDTAA